jgi:Mannosylglycerate hydrolase MGH1-like glycoside hydrolase domain
MNEELQRLQDDLARTKNWKRWGPYLSERQWATVREDYSEGGDPWAYFPHEHARSRAYRWGEDGLLGITDRECRLCFGLALWNGRDHILKERLFGLTGPEGNHGEDVKECYFYLDSSPTHSYLKALYKYPQAAFPYDQLVHENRSRSLNLPEFELIDTGVFENGRYFDVFAEYAKQSPNDIHIRITVANRANESAEIVLLPTLWFRNTWVWGCSHEGCSQKPRIWRNKEGWIQTEHEALEPMYLFYDATEEFLFTENETNFQRLYGLANNGPFLKDSFHSYIVSSDRSSTNQDLHGTKVAPVYRIKLAAGESRPVYLRLVSVAEWDSKPQADRGVFDTRKRETDEYYEQLIGALEEDRKNVARQAAAGLLWTKQFYQYIVKDWLEGDQYEPQPPATRWAGRNHDWVHVYSRDVISMPDKWEYPWFAAWDLAFHMLPYAHLDSTFAKQQLELFLREWYMHPNGQIPAYEFAFSDVNPPVHAWAAWRVYKISAPRASRDIQFLESVFHKLLLNFTWWVNRKDTEGNNIFSGGFLGLDNIGVFDRSKPLPTGGYLQQADGTAWMGFYCLTMLSMALELAQTRPAYEDMASKFFEHFIAICESTNTLGGTGLWHEEDGFYYDQLKIDGKSIPLKTRSLVGLLPLVAVEILEEERVEKFKGFRRRMDWFLKYRRDLAKLISLDSKLGHNRLLLAVPTRERLCRMLPYLLDENEFLSPFGIRSLSKIHAAKPYIFPADGHEYRVDYVPGEGNTHLFGGNSNWRGPVWFPINYLIVEALERYYHFYGNDLKVECPTGSGVFMNLQQVANEIVRRLVSLFLPNNQGSRPCHGEDSRYATDPHWKNLVLFYEYFHGETGRGCGASHQTGWTGIVARLMRTRPKTPNE